MRTVLQDYRSLNPYESDDSIDHHQPRVSAWDSADRRLFLFMFVVTFAYVVPGLFGFEFFRHTEADRALIAFEMWTRKDFLVPHLLGDLYVTKPPLYYATLAAFFGLAGGAISEPLARLPSALAAALLVAFQFYFLRRAGVSRNIAWLSSAVLATTGYLFSLSTLAEIDMCFALLSTSAIYCGYLSWVHSQMRWSLAAYLCLAAAVLTKGPPAPVFYVIGMGIFITTEIFSVHQRRAALQKLPFFLISQIGGAILLAGILTVWLLSLTQVVDGKFLSVIFHQEVTDRFTGGSFIHEGGKPWYYYIGSLFVGMLPWSVAWLGFLPSVRRSIRSAEILKYGSRQTDPLARPELNHLLRLSLAVLIPNLVLMSLSAGKASRYIFPLYPFAANIAAIGGVYLWRSRFEYRVRRGTAVFAALGILALCILPWFLKVAFPWWMIGFTTCACGAALAFLLGASLTRSSTVAFVMAIALCLLAFRVPYGTLFPYHRQQKESFVALANAIMSVVPRAETLYVMELFERHFAFYMIADGRKVLRLTPVIANELATKTTVKKDIYIIINLEEEGWRLPQFKAVDPHAQELARYKVGKKSFSLWKLDGQQAPRLNPKLIFPTSPSAPDVL
jgi:4-amino-4-deoxy-L-arabinose transferase-like glycosyltransferase